ncbi:MAG: IclR family transcriptional regulator [Porticoccaceae bacterium]|nr:IclR family transcriptional regulator [Porticoccaceae bacterium]
MAKKSSTRSESNTARRKSYSAPALEKGLDVLELLAREPDGLNLSDIAKRLNRSVGELFRMLVVLEQRGYLLVPPGSDRYQLSLKLFDLSHQFPPVKRLTAAATEVMRGLAFDIEQSCHLVIYYEGKGHVVVQQDAPSARIFSVRLGAEASLIDTCSGHILLAYADVAQRDAMLASVPRHHKKPTKRLAKELADVICPRGYESIQSAQALGVEDIGCPVFDHSGSVVAALVVPFLSYQDGSHPKTLDQALQQLQAAAAAISAALGYQGE